MSDKLLILCEDSFILDKRRLGPGGGNHANVFTTSKDLQGLGLGISTLHSHSGSLRLLLAQAL